MSGGRPSLYSDELADEICERIATTPRGLDFICDTDDALPCARTVARWLSEHEAFCQKYVRARERQADLLFDECLEIADDGTNDTKTVGAEGEERDVPNTEWISRSKLRVETRMRMAGKLAPKKYGDKLDVTSGGEAMKMDDVSAVTRLTALAASLAQRAGYAADDPE